MYVVFGATGNTGKVVADSLLAQKKPVRVVVRDAAKGEPWKARGVAVATVSDAKALENALWGADGAYILLPPDYATNKVLEDKKKEVAAFAAAIPPSGVKHVVLLSSYGAHQPDEPVRSAGSTTRRRCSPASGRRSRSSAPPSSWRTGRHRLGS